MTSLYMPLLRLLPQDPLQVVDINTLHADGTATVALVQGGGQLRVRNPLGVTVGVRAFLQGGQITGPAPALPLVLIDV